MRSIVLHCFGCERCTPSIDIVDDGHSEIRECSDNVLWESDHKGGCDTEARSRSSGRLMMLLVVTSGSE